MDTFSTPNLCLLLDSDCLEYSIQKGIVDVYTCRLLNEKCDLKAGEESMKLHDGT